MRLKKLLCLGCAVFFAGCNNNPVSDNGSNNNTNTPFAVFKSDRVSRAVVIENDSRISSQANSINQFSVKMFSELSKDAKGDENLFFSPYSITVALGMANAGARGETDIQIRKALQVNLEGEDFHAGINGLDQSLQSHSQATENLELNIVNSIWSQKDMMLQVNFLDILSKHYNAGINILDFERDPESCRVIINDWVSEQTHDRIKDLLPQGAIKIGTKLVLTNAIYFLADWLIKFADTLTDNQTFTRLDGSEITVPMMNLRDKPVKLLYHNSGKCRILELPYKGNRLAMDLILPDSGTYNNFEQNLSVEIVSELVNGLDSVGLVTVRIPRFEFTTASISLVDAFKNLGMTAPFSPSADFSGISHGSLAISDIIHKAFVKVDEKGTEAAAATAVIIGRVSDPAPPPEQFVANRPFIFFIRDTMTGAILFMGRILDPLVKE
ncbi:MAG: serpin family protein [Fibrobacter sp.]|jgi:serpin B|nr:serpin family protein [Fibrobacter sp.]